MRGLKPAAVGSNVAYAIKKLRVQPPDKLLLAEIYYLTGDYEQAKHFDISFKVNL